MSTLTESLSRRGYFISPNFFSNDEVSEALKEIENLQAAQMFRPAGVGRQNKLQENTAIRGDQISWLKPENQTPFKSKTLKRLEDIRIECNRNLFLGLDSFEAHYAVYEKGTHYQRHKDVFQTNDSRVLSVIIYLNKNWETGMGGELMLHNVPPTLIEPHAGTLVLFLSHDFEHEVLKTSVKRESLCGWFKKSQVV